MDNNRQNYLDKICGELLALCRNNRVSDFKDITVIHKQFETYDNNVFYIANKILPCWDGLMVIDVNCECGNKKPVSFNIDNGLGTPSPLKYVCSHCGCVRDNKTHAIAEFGYDPNSVFFCFRISKSEITDD